MKCVVQFSLGLLAVQAGVAVASAVTDLEVDTFDGFVNDHGVVMTEFYAPWCPACKELQPIYEEAASRLGLLSQDIRLARVDCVAEGALCARFETPIYPTIRVFKGVNEQEVYNGPRALLDIVDFVERRSRPLVTELTNDQSIELFRRSNDIAVVAYWKSASDSEKFKQIFAHVAKENLDYYSFGTTDNIEVATAEGISQPTLVLYNRADDTNVVYEGKFDADDITDWIDAASIPLVGELDRKWLGRYVYKNAPPLIGILAETVADRLQLTELVRPLAKHYKDKLHFAIVNTTESASIASKVFNVKGQRDSVLVIADQKQTFPINENIALTEDGVSAWIEDFLAGKLTPQVAALGAKESVMASSVIDGWKQGSAGKDEL